MRKRNSVKQLNRDAAHRSAMLRNMVTSLIQHERIKSTRARIKYLQPVMEKLITKAKKANAEGATPEQVVHLKREVLKTVRDRDAVVKLFEDIAGRFKERNGGYTRVLRLINRASDNSQMAMLELVDRKEKIIIQEEARARRVARLPKARREKMEAQMKAEAELKDTKKEKKKKKKKDKEDD